MALLSRYTAFQEKRLPVTFLRLLWAGVLVWFEFGAFFWVRSCAWPKLLPTAQDENPIAVNPGDLARILILTDTKLPDQHSYPSWPRALAALRRFIVTHNLRKSWRATIAGSKPDVVIFLGDMLENGRSFMAEKDYDAYYARFKSVFAADLSVSMFYMPGNRDVGLGMRSFSLEARHRFQIHFGPFSQQTTIAGHSLVLLDAPGFVEEDYMRTGRNRGYDKWNPEPRGPVEFVTRIAEENNGDPLILFTHIPLSRRDGASCGPLRERGAIHRGVGHGYQNTLGTHASNFLLHKLRPSVIFSGDDHDYCEHFHKVFDETNLHDPDPDLIREITLKSFSISTGIRPGFQLLSLASPQAVALHNRTITHEDAMCLLPDQKHTYLSVYMPLAITSLVFLLLTGLWRSRIAGRAARGGGRRPGAGLMQHERSTSLAMASEDGQWVSSWATAGQMRARFDSATSSTSTRVGEEEEGGDDADKIGAMRVVELVPTILESVPEHDAYPFPQTYFGDDEYYASGGGGEDGLVKPSPMLDGQCLPPRNRALSWTFELLGQERKWSIPINSSIAARTEQYLGGVKGHGTTMSGTLGSRVLLMGLGRDMFDVMWVSFAVTIAMTLCVMLI